jgi:hypothetical protein
MDKNMQAISEKMVLTDFGPVCCLDRHGVSSQVLLGDVLLGELCAFARDCFFDFMKALK